MKITTANQNSGSGSGTQSTNSQCGVSRRRKSRDAITFHLIQHCYITI